MEHSCQLSILHREVVQIERKSNQTDSFITLLAYNINALTMEGPRSIVV